MKNNFKKLSTVFLAGYLLAANMPLMANKIVPVATEEAAQAIGPYSQATVAGSYMFVSGQIAIDPTTKELVAGGIEEQTKQVLRNMSAILAAQGLTLENVVKTEVYLQNLKDFQPMNVIYAEGFSHEVTPARAAVQVARLPKDALIEISCIAYIPE